MAEEVEPTLNFTTEDPPADPVVFQIDGEQFYGIPWMPGATFLKYSRLISKGGLVSTGAIEEFFSECMEPQEHERFRKFIEDPTRRVSSRLLGDIFLGLFNRYGAGPDERSRPTPPSRPSQSGRQRTAGGSKAKRS